MGLQIYNESVDNSIVGERRDHLVYPLSLVFPGRIGGFIEKRLWLRNDDIRLRFTNITIQPVDSDSVSHIDGTGGYSVLLFEGDDRPVDDAWDLVVSGALINMPNIGIDTDTEKHGQINNWFPFWIKCIVPWQAELANITTVSLALDAVAHWIE